MAAKFTHPASRHAHLRTVEAAAREVMVNDEDEFGQQETFMATPADAVGAEGRTYEGQVVEIAAARRAAG